MAGGGGPAQTRRRERRAAERAAVIDAIADRVMERALADEDSPLTAAGVGECANCGHMAVQHEDGGCAIEGCDCQDFESADMETASLSIETFGATSFKDFPLSDRETAWDGGAAMQRWQDACGIGGDSEDWARFHTGFFWYDGDNAETVGAHHLLFVDAPGGTTTAVWRGVTTCAAAMQGSRGATMPEIPAADKDRIKAHIARYYAKAADKYDDPSIKAPWEADGNASLTAAPGDLVWAPEDGFCELLCDLNEIVNPSGDWDFPLYVCDVALSLDRALVCDFDEGEYYVAPIAVTGGDASLSSRSDWVEVEQAWVESDDEFASRIRERFTAIGAPNTADSDLVERLKSFRPQPAESVTADGATAPDIPAEHQEAETMPGDGTADGMAWSATITFEGVATDDGRIFAPGAITWRDLPLSLGVMMDTPHADVVTASPVCGRIDSIFRDGNLIKASGVFDDSDLGRDVARMVSDGTLRGVSVDTAIAKVEVAYRSDVLNAQGEWIGGTEPGDEGPSMADVMFGEEDVIFIVWEGVIGAVTICPFPAFADARIETAMSLAASADNPLLWRSQISFRFDGETAGPPLIAAAAPLTPPREWFDDPGLTEPHALTVDDDGRIFGHAATWGTCHIGIPGVCTTAPRSPAGYAYFHVKEVVLEDGERLSCGTLTLDTGHADRRLGRVDAARHYDDTGTQVADIVCGEDEHGIWFSGAVRPDLSEEQLRKLRGSSVSGDWRDVNGHLEFVALLAVNVSGFPVPRPRALVAGGESGPRVLSLIAAGVYVAHEAEPASEQDVLDTLRDVAEGSYADIAARALA